VHSTGLAPDQGQVLAATVFAHTAEAALAVLDQALFGAKLALHALIGEYFPEARRVRPWRLARARGPGLEKSQTTQ
jgi:outer membrane protein TolC